MNNRFNLPENNQHISMKEAAVASLAATAMLGVFANSAEAHPNHQTVAGVAEQIENKVERGQSVTFDANYDVQWSNPGHTGTAPQYQTDAPLTATVNGQERLFRVVFQRPKANGAANIDVRPIPKDATKSPSPLTTVATRQNPFNVYPITTTAGKLEITTESPVAQTVVRRADGKQITINVGQTSKYGK